MKILLIYIVLIIFIASCSADKAYIQKRNFMLLKSTEQPANKKFHNQKHKGAIHKKKIRK